MIFYLVHAELSRELISRANRTVQIEIFGVRAHVAVYADHLKKIQIRRKIIKRVHSHINYLALRRRRRFREKQ